MFGVSAVTGHDSPIPLNTIRCFVKKYLAHVVWDTTSFGKMLSDAKSSDLCEADTEKWLVTRSSRFTLAPSPGPNPTEIPMIPEASVCLEVPTKSPRMGKRNSGKPPPNAMPVSRVQNKY